MNMQKLCEDCTKCEVKIPIFSVLNSDEMAIINRDRYSVLFRKGEVIIKQGTHANFFLSLVSGFAKMYVEDTQLKNLILKFLRPGTLVGGPGIHISDKYHYTVIAEEEARVCFIDKNNFKEVLYRNNNFLDKYLELSSQNYGREIERMVSLSHKQMHGRIADALLYMSDQIFESNMITSQISRNDIADFTAMAKDSAIRILKEFERDNIISLDGRTIEILDSERLRTISLSG